MESQQGFFDFAAEVGLTKHFGGLEGTEELAGLCHICDGAYVLDAGCGAGVTACFLTKRYNCHVVGVDIRPRMVERSSERARKERVADRVEFRVADVQNLPFEVGMFDAVITESVTIFPQDKQKAVNEYVRVTKPAGYVGLNESVWLKVPPPPEVVVWASQDAGANVQPLTSEAWTNLLVCAGLKVIMAKTNKINVQAEEKGLLKRYGLGGTLVSLGRMLLLYARSPAYRKFVKGVRQGGVVPANLEEYFGYGLFVGQK